MHYRFQLPETTTTHLQKHAFSCLFYSTNLLFSECPVEPFFTACLSYFVYERGMDERKVYEELKQRRRFEMEQEAEGSIDGRLSIVSTDSFLPFASFLLFLVLLLA